MLFYLGNKEYGKIYNQLGHANSVEKLLQGFSKETQVDSSQIKVVVVKNTAVKKLDANGCPYANTVSSFPQVMVVMNR